MIGLQFYPDRHAPEAYLMKLELKRHDFNTCKTHIAQFEKFINHHPDHVLVELSEQEIRTYIQLLIQQNRSNSYINQAFK